MARALPTSAVLAAAEATAGCVAEAFGVPREALLGRTRRPEAAIPRMACYLLLRERFGLSWAAIGEAMRRDPATVIHGVGRCRQLARHSAALRGSLDASLAGLRATRVSQDWQPRAARFVLGFVDGRPVDADDAFRRPTDRCAQAGCGLTRAEHHAGHAASRAAA
jgi:hypothetical protein